MPNSTTKKLKPPFRNKIIHAIIKKHENVISEASLNRFKNEALIEYAKELNLKIKMFK